MIIIPIPIPIPFIKGLSDAGGGTASPTGGSPCNKLDLGKVNEDIV